MIILLFLCIFKLYSDLLHYLDEECWSASSFLVLVLVSEQSWPCRMNWGVLAPLKFLEESV